MKFDPENHINKLCAQGIMLEGEGKPLEAKVLFLQAWEKATGAREKFTAAHYLARHQDTIEDKLRWDETALDFANEVDDPLIIHVYPSLYLNIGKCHEDLGDLGQAKKKYQLAFHYAESLPDDGYSNMIRSGIKNGISRVHRAH